MQNVYHLFPILCERRDELQFFLKERGVQTVIHYPIPPHRQECFQAWNHLSFPVTEKIAAQELSLPMGPVIREEEVLFISEAIKEFA